MGLFGKRKNTITVGEGTWQPTPMTEEEFQEAYPDWDAQTERRINEMASHLATIEAIRSDRSYSEIEP